jgi:hypothetical protein
LVDRSCFHPGLGRARVVFSRLRRRCCSLVLKGCRFTEKARYIIGGI